MLTVRRAEQRGHANYGWLDTYHSFSFGSYQDPRHTGFRTLRVMNEDFVEAGKGFATHPHRDMEIVTYVLEGALEHRDSLGNGEILRAGEFQTMTAGSGITHSEFNPSSSEPVHLYQIWLKPEQCGLPPSYQQRVFSPSHRDGRLQLVASRDGGGGSLKIQQRANVYLADLTRGQNISHQMQQSGGIWVQVLRGEIQIAESVFSAGDGIAVEHPQNSDTDALQISTESNGELMLFDLA